MVAYKHARMMLAGVVYYLMASLPKDERGFYRTLCAGARSTQRNGFHFLHSSPSGRKEMGCRTGLL